MDPSLGSLWLLHVFHSSLVNKSNCQHKAWAWWIDCIWSTNSSCFTPLVTAPPSSRRLCHLTLKCLASGECWWAEACKPEKGLVRLASAVVLCHRHENMSGLADGG